MNVTNVQATTVFEQDYVANIDKFYTCYSLGPYEIRQWGRVGAIGQFSIQKHDIPMAAVRSTNTQIMAKERKGYANRQVVTFQFDLDRLGSAPGKDQAKMVAIVKDAAGATQPAPRADKGGKPLHAEARTKTVVTDRFEDFADRALKAITQSVTDPQAAGVTYAKLNEEWVELQAVTEKAQSYLSTLDQLVNASMS